MTRRALVLRIFRIPLWILLLAAICVAGVTPDAASGQQTSSDWAWKRIVLQDSLAVEYVLYSEADNSNNGVALKLVNHAACPAEYDMTLIFRSDDRRVEQSVSGRIGPNTLLTGDAEGLFFIPFDDGTPIGEIGIRGLDVRPDCRSTHCGP